MDYAVEVGRQQAADARRQLPVSISILAAGFILVGVGIFIAELA